ncbi:MAG: hypothetical protein ACREJC_09140 [Tepidisphaeraceae bacterium]
MKHIVLASALLFALWAPSAAKDPSPARLAYENFKSIAGNWQGRSSKGWTEKCTYTTIAGGSCVMESSFDAHPNEQMVTMFYLDGDDLMLTHYCVAKNAPRMKATEISPDGKRITFTFVDGANLPTRDKGHMDKAVFNFESAQRFTSQWTWYADGKEQWLENITHERIEGAAVTTKPAN